MLPCRLWFGLLLFGVAFTVAVAEALSRVIEEDRERRRQERHIREAVDWPSTGDILISDQVETRWNGGGCVADSTVRITPEQARQMERDGQISWT